MKYIRLVYRDDILVHMKTRSGYIFAIVLLSIAIPVSAQQILERNLRQGDTGSDVKVLQSALNKSVDTQVAPSGVGSRGNETEYFGSLTKSAVIKFQEKYAEEVLAPVGLVRGTGFVGQYTRAKINQIILATTSPTTTAPAVPQPNQTIQNSQPQSTTSVPTTTQTRNTQSLSQNPLSANQQLQQILANADEDERVIDQNTLNLIQQQVQQSQTPPPNLTNTTIEIEPIGQTDTTVPRIVRLTRVDYPKQSYVITGQNFTPTGNILHFGNEHSFIAESIASGHLILLDVPESLPVGTYNFWITNDNGSTQTTNESISFQKSI